MTTEQLQYLLEISRNPSLNSASQKLHITPQALSISIKKLENELSFSLLERSYKGISLNNDWLWLAGEAEKFLKRISDRQSLHSISNAAHISGELPPVFQLFRHQRQCVFQGNLRAIYQSAGFKNHAARILQGKHYQNGAKQAN